MTAEDAVWEQHALSNRLQSLFMLALMLGFLALLGWLIWGDSGIFWLLLPGIIFLFYNPVASPGLIMRMYHASPLTPAQAPALNAALQELSRRGGLEQVPQLFYIPSTMVNAFAVGTRDNAVIAVTDGLLNNLNQRELLAVLGHELSHVRNNDMWVMAIADLISRLTSLLSLFGQVLLLLNLPLILMMPQASISWLAILLLIFAPSLSALAQLGLSRIREYDADLGAARLTNDPLALASALVKIEQLSGSFFENIFLPGRRIPEPSLLRTHPSTEERVRRLRALQASTPFPELDSQLSFRHTAPDYLVQQKPRWHINGLWH